MDKGFVNVVQLRQKSKKKISEIFLEGVFVKIKICYLLHYKLFCKMIELLFLSQELDC